MTKFPDFISQPRSPIKISATMGHFAGAIADTKIDAFTTFHPVVGDGEIKHQKMSDLRPITDGIPEPTSKVCIDTIAYPENSE